MNIPWKKHKVSLYKPKKTCDGYTLIMPFTSKDMWLIDMRGNYVYRWRLASTPRNHGVLLLNGNMLYGKAAPLPPQSDMSFPQAGNWGTGGGIIELNWESNEVWSYVDKYQSHTFCRLENGNTLIPRVTRIPDEMAPGLKGGLPGSEDRGMMWTDSLHEVTPEGKIVWEWNMADHLDPKTHKTCPLGYRSDFTHMNSAEFMRDGDILVSFRNIDTICIIDKETHKIKWEWGPGDISHQHSPTELDNGNILLFDNGAHRQDNSLITYSRALEVSPVTGKIEWQYKADPPQDFYSSLISGCQRLPNGNTLICEGMKGRIFEVTMDGEMVWEYFSPFYAPHGSGGENTTTSWPLTNALFRAYRYMPDYPGLKGKDLSPEKHNWINRLYGPEAFDK